MRVLVTGANGQLGNEMQVLAKENPQHTYFFLLMYRNWISVTNKLYRLALQRIRLML